MVTALILNLQDFLGQNSSIQTMVQVVDLSLYPGKGRPASGKLQQMETADSERQSLSAPTAEAPPTAWAQPRTPRDLNNGLPERLQRQTLLEAVNET